MSKTGDTKKKILEMLEQKSETLTDISTKLGLAPSTVSQHLQELMDSGSIRLVEDRPRKWKYYEINKGRQTRGFSYYNSNYTKSLERAAIPIAVIAIALIAAVAFFGMRNNLNSNPSAQEVYLAPGSTVPAGSTVFSVSDSPQLYNVSALYVTVVNASVRSESTGKWYKIPIQASTFNLVQLDNISSLLSGVMLKSGNYDDMVLYISNVSAIVNGTRESVFLPSGKLFVVGDFNISNSTTNWINVDFDLEHSLHVAPNGSMIMLPVITVKDVNDSNLQVNNTSIIVAQTPVMVRKFCEWGMDQTGNLISNYSTPQNWSISTVNGRLNVNGQGSIPILIRTNHGLIIGGNANELFNISIGNSSMLSTNGSTSQMMIEYRKCLRTLPIAQAGAAVQNSNQTPAQIAIIMQRCCMQMPMPIVTGNAQANASVGNTTAANARIGGSYLPIGRCCFPIVVASQNGNVRFGIRRCLPTPITLGINSTQSGSWADWNSTQINISMNRTNGNFNEQCTLQNGALSCNSNSSVRPQDIVANIGASVVSWGSGRGEVNGSVGGSSAISSAANGSVNGIVRGIAITVSR